MIAWLWDFFTTKRFTFGDLFFFYILWQDIIPWLKRKWEKFRGQRHYCIACREAGASFEFYSSDPEVATMVARRHNEQFHS